MASGYRPQRTVKFMAYAAEEVGLRGSAAIAAQHRNADVNVVGVLQLDMTNYKGTPTADIVMITDRTSAAQNAFVEQLVDTYLGLPRATTQCGYGCSDHSSWNSQGYAASFPFEATFNGSNPTIHSANDTLAQSGNNADHAVKFSKLAAAYVAELAKGGFGEGNQPPTADAGPDQSTATGVAVTLNGSGSDPDGGPGPLAFAWSQVSGPPATLSDADRAVATVTAASEGVHVFRLTVSDGSASATDDVTVTASSPGGTAVFDAALQAPRCSTVGSSCDTGTSLVLGRGTLGPEPNQPNTIDDSCADGASGTFHRDESNDRIRVFTTDGTSFGSGKIVTIEASVWAWTTPSADATDFFHAADATNPVWTLIGTRVPAAAGAQTLSIDYTLPAGALQAVRVQHRYQGSATACASGAYSDRDDLAFAVSSAPVTTVFFDDFETATGWTPNPNATDTAITGAWERGDPEATTSGGAMQLGSTVSGVIDLVTGRLAGPNAGANDVDGGVTSIQTPAITLPSTRNLTLSFQYYLAHGSNASSADYFRVFVVGSTTTQVFQSLGAPTTRIGAWTSASTSLDAFAGQTVRLRFEATDAATPSLVEAGVDDVRVTQR
jgi:leucyl aminopeptidase